MLKLLSYFDKLSRKCFSDLSGATVVEFAVIAPVLFFIMLGAVEMGVIMYETSVIEGATYNASRLGKTGFNTSGLTRDQTILNMIQQKGGGLIKMNNVTMTSKIYSSFSNIGDPEPYTDSNHNGHYDVGEVYTDINGNAHWDADMGTAGLGNAGDVVVYTISYPYNVTTPLLRMFIGTNGVYTIAARAVVRNEPWNPG